MRGLIFSILIFWHTLASYSQCEPDLVNCIDVGDPGQICPEVLAIGTVGVLYEEYITIIAPDTAIVGEVKIGLAKIVLDSIENIPNGLEFNAETVEFFPNQGYCVSLTGTPTESGTFFFKIYVTPYILFADTYVALVAQVDSTISLTIESALSIRPIGDIDFSLIQAYPNPFKISTRIGFMAPLQGEAELIVFSMLGRQIYNEVIMANKGANYFNFKGEDLLPGYYMYAIIREQKSIKGRIIKNR